MSGHILRPYQWDAFTAGVRDLRARRRAVLVMATGAGKTVVFAAIAEEWRQHGRVLVLAHREELLDQAAAKIAATINLTTGIEQAERTIVGELPDVVIASVQTLQSARRRERFAPDAFDLVIVDEAHHAPAQSYRTVLDYFGGAARLGVTATPDRADGKPLSSILGNTVFRYGIRRAVRDGYLVDIRRVIERLDVDLSRISVRAGDFDAAELEAELTRAPAVAAVADAVLKRAGERPTVLFCAGVLHSKAVAAALNERAPGSAAYASGAERAGVAAFTEGRVRFLANADLTTEGFDHPPLSCVALVRPTKSNGRCTQQVGRGTRLSPETGKTDLLVVEFVGHTSSGQVSTVDVVGCDMPATVRLAAENMLDRQPSLSVLDALERAAAQAGGSGAVTARSTRAIVDPLAVILRLDGMVLVPENVRANRATPAQQKILADNGIHAAGLDVRQAAMLVAGIRWRAARGRSSPAQALELARLGLDLEVTAERATRLLARHRTA